MKEDPINQTEKLYEEMMATLSEEEKKALELEIQNRIDRLKDQQ